MTAANDCSNNRLVIPRTMFFPDLATQAAGGVNPRMMLFLDVATRHTGYALMEESPIDPSVVTLAGYGVFSCEKGVIVDRCRIITSKVSNIIHTIKPGKLVMEYPTIQGGHRGTAASRSGGMLMLAYLCGRIDACWEFYLAMIFADNKFRPPAEIERLSTLLSFAKLLTYREWNGQTPKHVTCRRVMEHFGIELDPETTDNDCADAIMMGKWYCEKKLMLKVLGKHEATRQDM